MVEKYQERILGPLMDLVAIHVHTPWVNVAITQLGSAPRAYHRILKLSRTIADLAGSDALQSPHLAEALQYRRRQRE